MAQPSPPLPEPIPRPGSELGVTRTRDEWIGLACETVLALVDTEHAVTTREIEAKVSERPWGGNETPIDAHHVTNALRQLAPSDLAKVEKPTKGGRSISVWQKAGDDSHRTKRAGARKRLLQARYNGWAMGTGDRRQLIGRPAERVVNASMRAAAPTVGYRMLGLDGEELSRLPGGTDVPFGPLDNGAQVVEFHDDGSAGRPVVLLVEVKDVRQHLYPADPELHALLAKAAKLQVDHAERRFLPVLVGRWVHQTTFWMAAQCGFVIAAQNATNRQFISNVTKLTSGRKDATHHDLLHEVRAELGFLDLTPSNGQPHDRLVDWFERVPLHVLKKGYADRWAAVAPGIADVSRAIQQSRHGVDSAMRTGLRKAVGAATGTKPTW